MEDGLQSVLRSRGYRMTPQRQLVLEAVRSLHHATPDEIAARVQQTASGVNLSTVYRTLELLEELGLVTHTHLGHGAPQYHAHEPALEHHVHLVCRDCGRVIEVPAEVADGFGDELRRRYGFEVDIAHMALFGRCESCREGAEPVTGG